MAFLFLFCSIFFFRNSSVIFKSSSNIYSIYYFSVSRSRCWFHPVLGSPKHKHKCLSSQKVISKVTKHKHNCDQRMAEHDLCFTLCVPSCSILKWPQVLATSSFKSKKRRMWQLANQWGLSCQLYYFVFWSVLADSKHGEW